VPRSRPTRRPRRLPTPLDRSLRRIGAGSVLATALLLVGAEWASAPSVPDAHAEADFPVRGLHCAIWCSVRVDAAIGGWDGVYDVAVDTTAGRVTVRYDADRVDPVALSSRLAEHSYPARGPWSVREEGREGADRGDRPDLPTAP